MTLDSGYEARRVEQTITEQDLDRKSRDMLQGLEHGGDQEPDLAIDGLSDSFLSRLVSLFSKT